MLINSVGGLYWLPLPFRHWIYRACGVPVGGRTRVFPGQLIRPGTVSFGDGVLVNVRCTFEPGDAEITVEDEVFIGPNVTFTATTHDLGPSGRRAGALVSDPIRIGRGAWIGAGATILPGVTVAPGCVIAAGAVVTRSTEPDGLYAGVPARRLRSFDDQLAPTVMP